MNLKSIRLLDIKCTKKFGKYTILGIFICVYSMGCTVNSGPQNPSISESEYISQLQVEKKSDAVQPLSINEQRELTVDFSEVDLVKNGTFNDLEINYQSADCCDFDVWVYNVKTQSWDQIGFTPTNGICCQMPSVIQHVFSYRGYRASDYLNEQRQMKVKGTSVFLFAYALKVVTE